jgi:hypothetical protein
MQLLIVTNPIFHCTTVVVKEKGAKVIGLIMALSSFQKAEARQCVQSAL